MYKKCTKCNNLLLIENFGPEKRTKDGLRNWCRKCANEVNRQWVKANPAYLHEKGQRAYAKNKEKIKARAFDYWQKNKEKTYLRNKKYAEANKEKIAASNKNRRNKNKDFLKAQRKIYVEKNRDAVNKLGRARDKKKRIEDPDYKLKSNMRGLIKSFTKRKGERTSKVLGYNHIQLVEALGGYPKIGDHIDHKIPISWFSDFTNPKMINDLRNLQILTASENCVKNNKKCCEIDFEYYELIFPHIQDKYKLKLKHNGTTNTLQKKS